MRNGVRLVVDGMTGVGKTSLMNVLVKDMGFTPYEEIFRDENNLLGKYYNEGSRWCFPMQLSFLNNRYAQYKEACEIKNAIMDRSIFTDPIFAGLYYKIGDMEPEEYYVYKSIFRTLIGSLEPPELVVYLDVSSEEAIRRIKLRGREDELKVSDSYWRHLYDGYTEYYNSYQLSPILKIDVNEMDFANSEDDRNSIVNMVKNWSW
jgi:deoxyadenosine/deoxycytidine kinase